MADFAKTSLKAPARDLKFSDSVMFAYVMKDKDICKGFLELILGIEIDRIQYSDVEKSHVISPFSKAICMDVFVKGTGQVFDIEMQASHFTQIGYRLRYYQGAMDTSILERGQSYSSLPESFIIFLCTDDPFKAGLCRYTFKPTCVEDKNVVMHTKQTWIILNARSWKISQNKDIADLLEYVSNGTVSDTLLVKQIDSKVQNANNDPIWKDGAMGLVTLEESWALEKGFAFEEGKEEGKEEGFIEGQCRTKALVSFLLRDNRLDDLKRSTTDEEFCDQLYTEYGL